MLKCENLKVAYGNIEVIHGISFSVPEKSIFTIIGANGAGKSTILRTISGLLSPTHGSIMFNNTVISGKSPKDIIKLGISHVPEGRRIFPGLTVEENLWTGGTIRNQSKKQMQEDINHIYEIFPRLKERRNQLGWSLSGGEQQMLAIGRGLMCNPKMILLDEPSLGLAPILVERVFEKILDINKEGTTILLVEQNAKLALEVSDYACVIRNGEIAISGSSKELMENPEVKKAYLEG